MGALEAICFMGSFSIGETTRSAFLRANGFGNKDILKFHSFHSRSCLIFEIPSGFISKYAGVKETLCCHFIFKIISKLLLVQYSSMYSMIVLSFILDGIGYSLLSGTLEDYTAQFGQTYKIDLRELFTMTRNFRNASKIIAAALAGFLITVLSGGYLQVFDAILGIFTLIVCFTLPPVPDKSTNSIISWDSEAWGITIQFAAWCCTNILWTFVFTEIVLSEQGFDASFWSYSSSFILTFKILSSKLPKLDTPVWTVSLFWIAYSFAIYVQSSFILLGTLLIFTYFQLQASISLSVALSKRLHRSNKAIFYSVGSLFTTFLCGTCLAVSGYFTFSTTQQSIFSGFFICTCSLFMFFLAKTFLKKDETIQNEKKKEE